MWRVLILKINKTFIKKHLIRLEWNLFETMFTILSIIITVLAILFAESILFPQYNPDNLIKDFNLSIYWFGIEFKENIFKISIYIIFLGLTIRQILTQIKGFIGISLKFLFSFIYLTLSLRPFTSTSVSYADSTIEFFFSISFVYFGLIFLISFLIDFFLELYLEDQYHTKETSNQNLEVAKIIPKKVNQSKEKDKIVYDKSGKALKVAQNRIEPTKIKIRKSPK